MAKLFSLARHLLKNHFINRTICTTRLLNKKKNLIDFIYDVPTNEVCIKTSYHISINFGLHILKHQVHFYFSGDTEQVEQTNENSNSKDVFIFNGQDMKVLYNDKKKSGDINFNECLIEMGPMSLLDIDAYGIITILNYTAETFKLRALGDIIIKRLSCACGSIETFHGNIFIGSIYADFLGMRAYDHGNINIGILTGHDANVCTYYGHICTQFSKFTKSNFTTHFGDIYLKNVHRNCDVQILENGSLKMTAISGQFNAYVKSGNVFIHISGVLRQSTLTVDDTKDCHIFVADFFFDYGSVSVKGSEIYLTNSDLVKHGKLDKEKKTYELGNFNNDYKVNVNVNGPVILGALSMPEVYLTYWKNIT